MKNIEYKMPVGVAKNLLKMRSDSELKMNPNTFLCKIVNEQYNLLGKCTKVVTY